MKRSEMLETIRKVLSQVLIGDANADMAKQVLRTVEKAGMLPPIEPGRTVHDLDLGAPEWEPE